MNTVTLERLDAIVRAAAKSLFSSHGLTLGDDAHAASDPPSDHELSAAIGYASPRMHGAVVMTTRKDVVARTWPETLRGPGRPTERDVCSWAGELVNQLLGRIKNALVPFGLAMDQGTPTVVAGWHLHRVPASTAVARRYAFTSEAGLIFVYFDAALADGFVLDEPNEGLRSASEGDLQLF
jgi:hypothetical protein